MNESNLKKLMLSSIDDYINEGEPFKYIEDLCVAYNIEYNQDILDYSLEIYKNHRERNMSDYISQKNALIRTTTYLENKYIGD